MKKTFISAAAALMAVVACNKVEQRPIQAIPEDGAPTSISVDLLGMGTKATVSDEANEAKVSKIDILVFNASNGELDGYASGVTSPLNCSCTKGNREIYAIVNADSDMNLASVSKKADLLAKISKLSSNSLTTGFVMTGSTSKNITDAANVSISVNRIASRVWVKKVTKNFSSSALNALEFKVVRFYLTNVVAQDNVGGTFVPDATASYWINKMKYETSNGTDALTLRTKNEVVTTMGEYAVADAMYAYPNPTVDDANGGTFTARHTRWVLEATIGGTTYYYPVTLPVLESNKSYEINNITITHVGSLDPDTPVEAFEVPFTITVNDWEQVLVEGGDITI